MRARQVWMLVAAAACGGKDGGGGDSGGGSAAPKPVAKVVCAELPGAARSSLQASKDGKTLYYVEQAARIVGDERVVTYNLHAYDVAAKSSKLLTPEVSLDTVVAPDGTVIFRKPNAKLDFLGRRTHSLVIVRPGKTAEPIEPPKKADKRERELDVPQFLFDAETSTIVFTVGEVADTEMWKVPLAGGVPENLGKTYRLHGIVDKTVIHSAGFNKLVKQPLATGTPSELKFPFDSFLIGFSGTSVLLKNKYNKRLSIAPLTNLETKTDAKLDHDQITMEQGSRYLVAQHKRERAIHRFDKDKLELQAVIRGIDPSYVLPLGDQLAMLAIHDTDGDGSTDSTDEADLCFVPIQPEPITIASRTIPKQFTELAGALVKVAKDNGLDNAQARFSDDELVEIVVANGPSDLDKLRALVSAIQTKVTELSKLPRLSAAIAIEGNGRRALSRWDSRAGQFLVSAGMGTAQVVDRKQYAVEVDPKISLSLSSDRYNRDSEIGEATCSGTIKNISNMQLTDLEAECTNVTFGRESKAKSKVVPSTLAPNASGTYTIKLGVIDGATQTPLSIYGGGTRLAYLNAFAAKRADAILAAALKVQEQTKLSFWSIHKGTTGASYSRKKVIKIALRANKALAEGSDADRRIAAEAALPLLRDYIASDKNLEGEPMILILRPGSFETAWTYKDGKLTEGELRDSF